MSDEGRSLEDGSGRTPTDPSAYFYLVMMVLIGSTTAPATKFVVRELPVGLIPLVRFGVSGLVLLPFVWRSQAFWSMLKNDLPRLLLTAACCVPINQLFFLNGARLAPTTHVALIYASCPLVVLALATTLGQERFAMNRLLGVVLSVVGVLVIAVGNLGATTSAGRDVGLGDLLLIGAVVSWGTYLTVNKPLIAKYGSLPVLAGTFLFGGLLDLPIAASTFHSWTSFRDVSTTAWIALFHLTLIVTILGLLFQNLALQKLDSSQVASFNNVGFLMTMTWGHLLFGDRLTPTLALGGGLIMLGLFGTNRSARKPLMSPEVEPLI